MLRSIERTRVTFLQALREERFDWVAVTSPEAARVLAEAWQSAGQPRICLAVVGDGAH